MTLTRQVRQNSQVLLVFTLLMVGWCWIQSVYFQAAYPENTFLLRPDDPFADFRWLYQLNENLNLFTNRFRSFGANYPPFAHLLALPFTMTGYVVGLVVFQISLLIAVLILWRSIALRVRFTSIDSTCLFLSFALSYPILLCFERANLESLVFLLVAVSFTLALKSRRRWALALFCVATAAKVYPIFFLFVFYRGKRLILNLIRVGLGALILNFVAIWVFKGNFKIAFEHYQNVAPAFHEFIVGEYSISYNNSIYAMIRAILLFANQNLTKTDSDNLLSIYGVFSSALTISVLFQLNRQKYSLPERSLVVSLVILVAPAISFDYKLTYLLVPLSLLLSRSGTRVRGQQSLIVAIVFLILFKGYYYPHRNISIAPILNPAIGLLMIYFICYKRRRIPTSQTPKS